MLHMRTSDISRLAILSAIWGFSFIFMRVLAPTLGPVVVADMRVLIAGIALALYFKVIGYDAEWKKYWKQYLIIGCINSAFPFILFSYSALHLPAGYMAILNSTSPLFVSVFAALWLSEALTLVKFGGLLLGLSGVMMITKIGESHDPHFAFAVAACLLAAMCYGIGGIYIRKYAKHLKPMAIAGASQLISGVLLFPAIFIFPPTGEITPYVAGFTIFFAITCSAIAYVIYYRLLADVGPTRALTVTFTAPVFSMIWAMIFLGEPITSKMIGGGVLILMGAYLVLKKPRISPA